MQLNFVHIFSWPDITFLVIVEYYSIVWMYRSLFIHSHTEGYLGGFQVWAIMSKAAINFNVQII